MDLEDEGRELYRPRERALSPGQSLGDVLGSYVNALVDRKRKLTKERVDSVLPDGRVVIRGSILPVTGRVPIVAGETVAVAWRDRRMEVVMMNQARRGGSSAPDVQQVTGIVEELFVSESDAGELSVWFRNSDQFKPVVFVDDQGQPGNAPDALNFQGGTPLWGKGDADFFVFSGTLTTGPNDRAMAVYRLNRPTKNEPFPNGHLVTAKLVKLYNLTTDPATFGTMSITGTDDLLTQTATASGNVRYTTTYEIPGGGTATEPPFLIRVQSSAEFAGVAPNGELLVTIRVRAQTIETAQTNPVFEMGMLLVNVDRSQVMANRLAGSLSTTVYLSLVSTPVCTTIGTADVNTSLGGSPADAGEITVLSLTGVDPQRPADPNQAGTFNNYALLSPAVSYSSATEVTTPPGNIFCAPLRATVTLSIIGELEAENVAFASFPGSASGPSVAQVPRLQGSRTMLVWAPYTESGVSAGPASIRDLTRGVTSQVSGSSDLIFGTNPPNPSSPSVVKPLVHLLQASLIYSPFDNRPPFNHQFFIAGHSQTTGMIQINLAALRKLTELAEQAKLAPAKSTTQVSMVSIGSQSRQALDSRLNLGARFQPGPL